MLNPLSSLKSIFICFLIVPITYNALQAQTLNILSNQYDNGEMLTGANFSLESTIQIPAGCSYATAQLNLPPDIYLDTQNPISDVIWQCVTCSGNSILIESIPGAFDGNSGSNGGDATSVQFNLRLDMGPVCEGVNFDFEIELEYYDEDMNTCGSQTTDVASFTSAYIDDYWQVQIVKQTDDDYMCIGGYTKYRITIPNPPAFGGYNSSDVLLASFLPGEIHKVFDESYNELAFNYLCIFSCIDDCTPFILTPISLNVNQSKKDYYVVVNYDCNGCDYEASYIDPTTGVYATPPCQASYVLTDTDTAPFDPTIFSTNPTCCGTYAGPTSIFKIHSTNGNENVCPGACNTTSYRIRYDHTQSADDLTNFCITDEIHPNYDVVSFNFSLSDDNYFDNPYNTALVTFSGAGQSQSFSIGGSGINPNNFNLVLNGVLFDVETVEICYDQNILAFSYYLDWNYTGSFNTDNNVGDLIDVCATTSTGLSACTSDVIQACAIDINGSLHASKSGTGFLNSLQVNRGDKATIRIAVSNGGTADLMSGDLEMVLPTDLSYCSSTVEFHYDGTPTSTPPSDVGGTFSVNGQVVSLNDFDLEKYCTSM